MGSSSQGKHGSLEQMGQSSQGKHDFITIWVQSIFLRNSFLVRYLFCIWIELVAASIGCHYLMCAPICRAPYIYINILL
jgi:hypothetical protein